MNIAKRQKGSIALISTLIMAAIVLIFAIGMSEANISTSYQYLNVNSDKNSYYVAEACLEEAIIRLEENPAFTSTALTFDSETNCTISISGTDITITTNYVDYAQSYRARISVNQIGQANNVRLLNWSEI